jgi:FkbM family methyltransferase
MEPNRPKPGVLLWQFSQDLPFLEQKRREASGWQATNIRKDFAPRTVIDVGAAHGTPVLYEAFPEAHRVLIDPLHEYETSLSRWVAQGNAEYVLAAIGDREELVTINVDPRRLWGSSILEAIGGPPGSVQREVSMTTLDGLLHERKWAGPFGLKIDTEGFEHKVIQGASELLSRTQFVIAEVSVTRRFEGSYSFSEFIGLMDDCEFALCDVLDGLKQSHEGEVVFIDALFRRNGH